MKFYGSVSVFHFLYAIAALDSERLCSLYACATDYMHNSMWKRLFPRDLSRTHKLNLLASNFTQAQAYDFT